MGDWQRNGYDRVHAETTILVLAVSTSESEESP